jgi:acyl-CoA reductase-like NAD-dependent aldehyde dehydrogenase
MLCWMKMREPAVQRSPLMEKMVNSAASSARSMSASYHDVRAVSFTGGTATGRNIMKNAGLKKYSMELGACRRPVALHHVQHARRNARLQRQLAQSVGGQRRDWCSRWASARWCLHGTCRL